MGEIIFIGLGLFDEKDISLKGLDAAISCDFLFAEFYTARLSGTTPGKIKDLMGKTVEILDRDEMERGDAIIKAARQNKVGVLVAGDPMTATTHISLKLQAKKHGIKTRIIHGASIISSAPGLSGLHIYKFGRTTSIPFPKENYFPTSPYDAIKKNLGNDLHTLILLDIDECVEKYMRANQALKLLLEMEDEKKEGVISKDTLVCVLGSVGSDEPVVRAGYLSNLLEENFGEGLHCLIIPGKLHFMEAETLVEFAGAPREILDSV